MARVLLTEYNRSVGWSIFANTIIPTFSVLEIYDQDSCSLQDIYGFRSGAAFFYVGTTFVSPYFQHEHMRFYRPGHYGLWATFVTAL
jgi:hypothetical protein